MRVRVRKLLSLLYTGLAVFLLTSFAPCWADSNSARVLIIPFRINSDQDYSYLGRGIVDMLSTRLSQTGRVELVYLEGAPPAGSINVQTASAEGDRLKADYVVVGSLTILGSHLSTDAMVVDVAKRKLALSFSQVGTKPSDLFDHINLFADRTNVEVLGGSPMVQPQQAQVGIAPPRPVESKRAPSPAPAMGLPSGQPALGGVIEKAPPSWASEDFPVRMVSMAVGDVDGDGRKEVVFASDDTVYVHRFVSGGFPRVAQVPVARDQKVVGIDVADINNNGKAEIFVTAIVESRRIVKSQVLEWDGAGLRKIAEDLHWYLRVLNLAGRGSVLVGQQRGGKGMVFSGPVYEMSWTGRGYEPSRELNLPRRTNVFGFTYGDVQNTGREMIISSSPFEYVQIFDEGGNEKWTSPEIYGGSPTYLEYLSEGSSFGVMKETENFYLPQRIMVGDFNGDGKNELVLVKNTDTTRRLLKHIRAFKSGYAVGLEWEGKEFGAVWKTKEFSGYIADYAITDFDGDGRNELVLAIVTKSGSSFLGAEKSYVYIQKIGS